MKKSKRVSKQRPAARRTRVFRTSVFACALLFAGVATAVVTYASRNAAPSKTERSAAPAAVQSTDPYVTVEVGGRKMRVNAQTLQQGPLTQAESQKLADQLEGNKATDGLVEEKHADGTVTVDLQGRFQNVVLAKRNDDGSVSAACVDTPEAAGSFLRSEEPTETITGTGVNRKAASRQ
jgi:translation initiation factor 1 (eIF-1/SUI1)